MLNIIRWPEGYVPVTVSDHEKKNARVHPGRFFVYCRFLKPDTRRLHVGRVMGRTRGHGVDHTAFGTCAFEIDHLEGVAAFLAVDLKGSRHGLDVESHHPDFVDCHLAVATRSGASVVHGVSRVGVWWSCLTKFVIFRPNRKTDSILIG